MSKRTEVVSVPVSPPRIEYLRVENYRALRKVELDKITPLTALLGANGSGKSTVFDVFNFLSECFQFGLRHAWDRRGRGQELRTRGQKGPIVVELVAANMVTSRNTSPSFQLLAAALAELRVA